MNEHTVILKVTTEPTAGGRHPPWGIESAAVREAIRDALNRVADEQGFNHSLGDEITIVVRSVT